MSHPRPFAPVHLFSVLVFVVTVSLLSACAGTRAAYDSATTLEAKAFVVTEHYAALVKEAADLASQPGISPETVARMRAADNTARPLVLQLRAVTQTYTAAKTAENAAALQQALDRAVVQVSAFITVIRNR